MKKKTLFIAAIVFMCSSIISCSEEELTNEPPKPSIEINDANLTALLVQKGVDTDNDGEISEEEAAAVTALDLAAKGSDAKISDLTGLEKFVNLQSLVLSGHSISDLSPVEGLVKLTKLDVANNKLAEANFEKLTLLETLDISGNSFSAIDLSKNTALKSLKADNNQSTSININSCTELETLDISGNALTAIDLSKNSALKSFKADNNQFASINIKPCTALETVSLSTNKLETFTVTDMNNLREMLLSGNTDLYNVTASNCPALERIIASDCGLVDVTIYNNPKIAEVDFSNNKLLQLDVTTMPELVTLKIAGNDELNSSMEPYFTTIDLSANTKLTTFEAQGSTLTDVSFAKNPAIITVNMENMPFLTRINLKNGAFAVGASYKIVAGNTALAVVIADMGEETDYIKTLIGADSEVVITDDENYNPSEDPEGTFIPTPAPTDRPDDENQSPENIGLLPTPTSNDFGATLDDIIAKERDNGLEYDPEKTSIVDGMKTYYFQVNAEPEYGKPYWRAYRFNAEEKVEQVCLYLDRETFLVLKGNEFILNPNLYIMWPTITQVESKDGYFYFEVSNPTTMMGVRAVMLGEAEYAELTFTLR